MVGPYRKVTLLGKGGMGEVWEAVDTRTERTVALKILTSAALADPDLQGRFVREMRLAAEIENPYVVAVYDFSVGPPPYIAMRLIRGRNLATEIRNTPLPPERAVDIIQQIGNALSAAHDKNLRHRDVKPSNILLDAGHRSGSDHAYLIDWGIAHRLDPHDPNITRVGQLVGTPAYIAPERLLGGNADHRADIYSLAVVLYECLTGRVPYGPTGMAFPLHAHLTDEPRDLPDTIPAALQEVVAKGLAKDPDERYASATEFGEAAYLAVHPAPRSARTANRSWSFWPLAGAAAGAVAGGGLIGGGLIDGWWVVPALAVAGAGLIWGFTPNKEGSA